GHVLNVGDVGDVSTPVLDVDGHEMNPPLTQRLLVGGSPRAGVQDDPMRMPLDQPRGALVNAEARQAERVPQAPLAQPRVELVALSLQEIRKAAHHGARPRRAWAAPCSEVMSFTKRRALHRMSSFSRSSCESARGGCSRKRTRAAAMSAVSGRH